MKISNLLIGEIQLLVVVLEMRKVPTYYCNELGPDLSRQFREWKNEFIALRKEREY
jgi:hypothetical protein